MLSGEIRRPDTDYLLISRVSSEKRLYIPIGFLPEEVIAGDTCLVIPNATLYEFGVINSSMRMAWVRNVAGRLSRNIQGEKKTLSVYTLQWPVVIKYPEKKG
jgi:hypothetical protein